MPVVGVVVYDRENVPWYRIVAVKQNGDHTVKWLNQPELSYAKVEYTLPSFRMDIVRGLRYEYPVKELLRTYEM